MKTLTCIILWFFASVFASAADIQEVRNLFIKASTDEKACMALTSILQPYTEKSNPLLAGYKACATMMLAKYTFNPFRKYTLFTNGRDLLEKAIYTEGQNIELHFLRFTIQTNVPAFLGYHHNIQTDKNLLLLKSSSITDLPLKNIIGKYLEGSKEVTQVEKLKLKACLNF